MRSLVCSSDANAALCAGHFQPYLQFDAALQSQICDGVRFVPLREGERLTSLAGTQISVMSGKARLSSTGRTLNDKSTRTTPFRVSARGDILQALEDSLLALADCDFIDHLTAWHALTLHALDAGDVVAERWAKCQRAKPFSRLPLECAQAAFSRMDSRRVMAGVEVVHQGAPGDTFYALYSGQAEVWQHGFNDRTPHKIASLRAGDTFGEEALMNGAASAVSVRMASDGQLLTLPRAVYLDLIAHPPIQGISPAETKHRLNDGWIALDVRFSEEYQEGRVAQAVSLPLQALADQAEASLSRAERYVVVCTSGKRSAVAALLLAQRGYQVANLRNGLRDTGFELEKSQSAQKAVA